MQAPTSTLQNLEAMLQQRPLDLRLHEALLQQHQATGNFPKALAHCDFMLQIAPTHAPALITRARLMLEIDAPPIELTLAAQRLIDVGSPEARHWLSHILVRLNNAAAPPENLSVGGGDHFHYCGWRNLDGVKSPLNPAPFVFSPTMTWPAADQSMRVVYSSHCIEHLDDATVDRVLDETRRVLQPDGLLLLKIPDYEKTLHCLRAGDTAYFDVPWNLGAMTVTWPSRGLEPTLPAKAAAIFCGFWNDAYGSFNALFQGNVSHSANTYHGPAVLPQDQYERILLGHSPHEAAAIFRGHVQANEPSHHFNHQNAWDRAELAALLRRHGFMVLSTNADEICRRLEQVPTIREMFDISQYALAGRDLAT